MNARLDHRPRVLFVCVGNMCRSPMAEGFARALGSHLVDVYSAGVNPTGTLSFDSIAVMRELGVDISHQRSKGLDAVPVDAIDLVVNMSGRRASSFLPRTFRGRVVDWRVEDPIGRTLPTQRRVRDDILERVRNLLSEAHGANETPGLAPGKTV
jgi:arsenate reductase